MENGLTKDIITVVKDLLKGKPDPVIEGAPMAYNIVKAMSDKELKKRYMGKAPLKVAREAQEELYLRFVSPHALQTCSQCYGRGHNGWNDTLHQLQPCQCLQRVIRTEETKDNQKIILMN